MKMRETFDYEAEQARHMCAGCDKAHGGGRTMLGYVCTMYDRKAPKMMLDANECPHNYRRVRAGGKVRQGQQKQGSIR